MSEILTRVTWVDYVPKNEPEEDPIVRLCGRASDGERIVRYIEGCRPHTFVPPREDVDVASCDDVETVGFESGFETFDGREATKAIVQHPKQVNAVEDVVSETWESDIPFDRRATWDYGLAGYVRVPDVERCHVDDIETDIEPEDVDPIDPRVVIGDIEVVPGDQTFEEMKEEVSQPIVAVTLYDTFTEEFELIVRDPDGSVEGSAIRPTLGDHLGDHDLGERITDSDETPINYVSVPTEEDLLKSVIGTIQEWRPDMLSGWNWIDFDHSYLADRMREVLEYDDYSKISDIGGVGGYATEKMIKGVVGFDELAAFDDKMSWSEWRSLSLEYVASDELGVGKLEAVDVKTAYEQDRTRLASYNLLDVMLCVALTEKHEIEQFYLDIADLSGVQVYDVFYEKRLVDGYIASRTEKTQVLPNQTEKDIPEPAGGLVLTPSEGVEETVAVFDLKSLYPSSIIGCNISPETMVDPSDADVVIPGMPEKESDVGGSITEDDINWDNNDPDLPWSQRPKGFTLEQRGLVPEMLTKLFAEREKYKDKRDEFDPDDAMYDVYDRKQGAVKVIMNSFYGVLNSEYFRLAKAGMGDAITGVSRYVAWRAAEYIESMGYEVVYGDTDSVLVKLDSDRSMKETLLDAKGICNQLNDHMRTVAEDLGLPAEHPYLDDVEHGTDRHCWTFEFEKLYDSFIQCGKKKRYAGQLAWKEGKSIPSSEPPDVTGFESQRADVPEITAEVQTEVIRRVLTDNDFADVSEYVRDEIDGIRSGETELHEIGIPKSIGKPLEGPDGYGNLPRARSARFSNQHLGKEYGPGDSPWMYYVLRTPTGVESTDVIAIDWSEEIPSGYEVNEEKTITKAFESALRPIVNEMGWSFDELRTGRMNVSAVSEDEMEYSGDPLEAYQQGTERSDGSDDAVSSDDDESSESDSEDEWTGVEKW